MPPGPAHPRKIGSGEMRGRLLRGLPLSLALMLAGAGVALLPGGGAIAAVRGNSAQSSCPRYGRPAVAGDPQPGALRVFAIQFEQRPAKLVSADSYKHLVDCVMRLEVAPHLARHRPNLVVFD